MGKEDSILIIQNGRRHAVNELAGYEDSVSPELWGNMTMEEEGPSGLNEMPDLALSHPILLRSMGT